MIEKRTCGLLRIPKSTLLLCFFVLGVTILFSVESSQSVPPKPMPVTSRLRDYELAKREVVEEVKDDVVNWLRSWGIFLAVIVFVTSIFGIRQLISHHVEKRVDKELDRFTGDLERLRQVTISARVDIEVARGAMEALEVRQEELRSLAGSLRSSFGDIQGQAETLEGRFSGLERKTIVHEDKMDEIVALMWSIAAKLPVDFDNAIMRLKKHRLDPDKATNRNVHIPLGRMYYRAKEYDKAIMVLTAFIGAKEKALEGKDRDVADALYNRACYQVQKAFDRVGAPEKDALVSSAYEDLERAIGIKDIFKITAGEDPDFGPIKEEPRFRKIIG